MTPNEETKIVNNEDEFVLPAQVTVYTDPNANVCEGCQ